MNDTRATFALVRRRLDRRYAAQWALRFLLFGTIAALFAPLLSGTAALVIATLLLPLGGATESAHADTLRCTSFFTLPLYGRQLARALIVAPAISTVAAPLGFLCGLALRHAALGIELWVVVLAANVVAALVALGAVFREGARAWLYHVLGVTAGGVIAAPYIARVPHPIAVSLLLAVLLGFAALRAFGETLARYDPLPI